MFISTVALMDLFACSVLIPMELILMFTGYSIDDSNGRVCKSARCLDVFYSVSSSVVLIVIAIDRYLKICRPFCAQISPTAAKIICTISLLFGLSVSWPTLFLYENKTTKSFEDGQRVFVVDCSINRHSSAKSAMVFWILLVIFCLTGMGLITCLYCLIGFKVHRRLIQDKIREGESRSKLHSIASVWQDNSHGEREGKPDEEDDYGC